MANPSVPSQVSCDDWSLGTVQGCRGDFDFSLLTEETFLSIVPSALFLVFASARLLLAAIACSASLEVSLLVLVVHNGSNGPSSNAAAVLRVLATLTLALLSWLEHSRSPRPSTLINIYLLVSLACDAIQTRTLWLKHFDTPTSEQRRQHLEFPAIRCLAMTDEKNPKSPEERSGVLSRSLLIWVHGILAKGRKTLLSPIDLDPLREGLRTESLSNSFWSAWAKLAAALVRTLKWSLLAPIIPRLCMAGFTFCQPLLLREFLRYFAGQPTFVPVSTGYAFIVLYGVVYTGIAVSGAIYWRLVYKALVQMRGCIVSAVYEKTVLEIDASQADMDAPISLVSTDMEGIIAGVKDLHEVWANTIQAALTIWLLYRELGLACVAPAAVATTSSIGSMLLSSHADKAQVSWMEATQKRVGVMATAISGMRNVKLLGLSDTVFDVLSRLRGGELRAARQFRYIEVLTAVIAFMPLYLSPVFTLLVFVLQARVTGEHLDTVKAFVTLSLLQLMTQPLVWLFQAVPLLVASLGCIERVGKYLHGPCRRPFSKNEPEAMANHDAIIIRDGSLRWTGEDEEPVLSNVNINIPARQLTLVIGPVASGKSTLAKALVGQLPYVSGNIYMEDNGGVAFCDQEPFLVNDSIQANIVGYSDHELADPSWLDTVIQAVDLDNDLAAFPNGRETHVGSRASRLSGGQKQRVSIARALYSRKKTAVFDDVLSSLDAATKEHIFDKVFGPHGLFRVIGSTVVLFTHEVALLPRADHIIVLGTDGEVGGVGKYEDLLKTCHYVQSLAIGSAHGGSSPDISGSGKAPPRLKESSKLADDSGPDTQSHSPPDFEAPPQSSDQTPDALTRRLDESYYLGIYAVFQAMALLFLGLFSGFALTRLAVKVGKSLHQVLLNAAIWAPMSFFSSTDTGTITNRFSGDIILIDGDLTMALLETLSSGLLVLIQMIYLAVQSFYLKTSRQLRFLDLEARGPLQSQLLETIHGLPTIRSFGWGKSSLVLELLIAATAVILVAVALHLHSTSQGFLGVALLQLMSLSQELKMTVINYTDLETSLTAVSRIKSFEENTPSENSRGDDKMFEHPPEGWPQSGRVTFDSVSVSYDNGSKAPALLDKKDSPAITTPSLALDNFSLEIQAGQRVAIVGRSGSAKSTLLSALARMVDLASGSIHIDGLDTYSFRPSVVRSRAFNVIPQEPFFFYKTVALNLDPFGVRSDEEIHAALESVHLLDLVGGEMGGIRAQVDNFEADFSQGQKQLLALARALLKPDEARIVLVDEATSSVDQHTADLMRDIIEGEFTGRGKTVIAVAHQLRTAMEFDVVVVLDSGRIIEKGRPADLYEDRLLKTSPLVLTAAPTSLIVNKVLTTAPTTEIPTIAANKLNATVPADILAIPIVPVCEVARNKSGVATNSALYELNAPIEPAAVAQSRLLAQTAACIWYSHSSLALK
ncbi:ABC transporter [Rhypophila decipiens]|uniref:ABC transporter n=1 Tax=Rhypophila decipiens TaxID=261697 RepID=A0AAN6YFI9_9PEZI|nr:ABC transporter [Rhypophila decipiens]